MPKAGPVGPALFLQPDRSFGMKRSFDPISSVRRHLVTVSIRKEKACMAVQAFLLKGKEFRLTTDNEKEKGNWLLLKNHLFFTLSIIKFFYELCMKSFPTNYERFVTPYPQTTRSIMNKL